MATKKTTKKTTKEKQVIANTKPQTISQFYNTQPTGIDRSDIEWQAFKNLIRKNTRATLTNIVLRLYKWKLPEYLNERIIEWGYLDKGQVTIFKDPVYGILGLPSIENGTYNIYGEPLFTQVMGYNGWNETVKIQYFNDTPNLGITMPDMSNGRYGVVSYDNYARKRYMDYIDEFTDILTDNRIALYVATNRLKDPFILAVYDKAVQKNMQKLVSKIKNNDSQVLVVKEDIKTLNGGKLSDMIEKVDLQGNVESPKKLLEVYNANINTFLELIGINANPDPDKTQYVNDSQVNTNNSLIDLEQDVRFLNRQKLCEDVKKILGIEMSVEKNIVETTKNIQALRNGGINYDEPNGLPRDTE